MKKLPKIVCFGGGNALPKTVLAGLKKYLVDLVSVPSMVDDGGSTGRLRRQYQVLPPGDIRRHFVALAQAPQSLVDLFSLRFFKGELTGHNFGNFFITGLELLYQNWEKVLKELNLILKPKGKILPVTLDKVHLYAQLENGQIIKGETNIDIPKHDPKLKIKKVFLKPKAKAFPPVLKEIKSADLIVIGPGDFYSSLIASILPEGISKAICQSSAKKIFICPAMQKLGETNNFSVLDFTQELEKYLGCPIDRVIFNNFQPSVKRIKNYQKEKLRVLGMVKINSNLERKKFLGFNLLLQKGPIEYDPKKITKILIKLCRQ
jgi:uncharacterized cofD-like protein